MIKNMLLLLLVFQNINLSAQDIFEENIQWRAKQNLEFKDSLKSPLTDQDRQHFHSLSFFPISEKYYVRAIIELTPESKPFKMKTSTNRMADYRQYAVARFELNNKKIELPVYQSLRLLSMPGLEDYLFIPFTDLTNGVETYGGGRYVEAEIPPGDTLVIDFNKAYNPYCAYNDRYSCPIPPRENNMHIRVEAGELKYESPAGKSSDKNK